jgi:hypothetical protein
MACLVAGLAGSTCDKSGERDPLEHYCEDVASRTSVCSNISFDGCEGADCFEPCLDRAHAAADFSEACGDLWIDIYECLVAMPCDGILAWGESLQNDSVDYPCGKLEVQFHEACPDVPLYPGDAVTP